MSRYRVPTPDPTVSIWVEWDNPLQSFFAQAYREGEDEPFYRSGAEPGVRIHSVEQLEEYLPAGVTIPESTKRSLELDYVGRRDPTPLQRLMASLFEQESD